MILSFSKENIEKRRFVEKIWTGFPMPVEDWDKDYSNSFYELIGVPTKPLLPLPKIHTIRADKKGRWKVGNKIHFVMNNRQPNRFQFAPIIYVKGIQSIEIKHDHIFSPSYTNAMYKTDVVIVDDEILTPFQTEILAKNDGFDSAQDFWNYFNIDFKGKIIHWTDFKY